MGKNSILDQLLGNKEEIIIKVLQILEGKEAKTKFNLEGLKLKLGTFDIKLGGHIEVSVIPKKKR